MKKFLPLLAILVITALSYSSALKNEFTNWDDPAHVLEYPSIRQINFTSLQKIFTETVNNTYHPLTSLSFAIEHHFFGFKPFIFHLDNVLLHLAVVALVYLFCGQCGLSPAAATLATLIFGIHPIHVEAVAWVTARKDVLYAFFYLLALNSYLRYVDTGKKRFYVLTILLGLTSMLAKAMALSLPLILFLCDWLKKRKFSARSIAEKIPFFIYIVPLAAITYKTHSFVSSADAHIARAVLIYLWTFTFYILKFIWPHPLIPLYVLPDPVNLAQPAYLGAVACVALMVILFFVSWKSQIRRWLMFAYSYYFLSIFFLLRTNTYFELNWIVVADRYAYLPVLGFCMLAGYAANQLLERKEVKNVVLRYGALVVVSLISVIMAVTTFKQCKVWKNGLTLWDHAIKNSVGNHLSYNNRGTMYLKEKNWDLALADFSKSIEINSGFPIVYINRGDVYNQLKKYNLAFSDYTKAIVLNPNLAITYSKRGNLLSALGRYDLALKDFDRAIVLNPSDTDSYYNRGTVYGFVGQYEMAIMDFNKTLSLNPGYVLAYHNRGTTYFYQKRYDLALLDFNRAIALDPKYAMAYFNRSRVYFSLGQVEQAWGESLKAQALGYPVDAGYIQMLQSALSGQKNTQVP